MCACVERCNAPVVVAILGNEIWYRDPETGLLKHLVRRHVSPDVEVDVGLSAYRSQSSD